MKLKKVRYDIFICYKLLICFTATLHEGGRHGVMCVCVWFMIPCDAVCAEFFKNTDAMNRRSFRFSFSNG